MPASTVDYSTLSDGDLFTLPTDGIRVVYRRINGTTYIRHYPLTVVTDAGTDADAAGISYGTVSGTLAVYTTDLTAEVGKIIANLVSLITAGQTWTSNTNAVVYDIVDVTIHTETTQPVVNYTKHVPAGDTRIWTRPLMSFLAGFTYTP